MYTIKKGKTFSIITYYKKEKFILVIFHTIKEKLIIKMWVNICFKRAKKIKCSIILLAS